MSLESNSTTIILCFLSMITFITGFWFKFNPPKKINPFFGYRTKNSMKSKKRWNFAHLYSGKLFMLYSIILSISALLAYIFNFGGNNSNIIVIILFIIGTFLVILKTEKATKKRFND